ncbi:Hemopexin [Aspergillus parasiticus]|uniref:Hemopexin n=1 Tax=Aspergillus parasiticus TaxID=5067 RepID=A0A5N6E4N7_ASPPA|nr:Hemopexin [Aspergillus parasiticus]
MVVNAAFFHQDIEEAYIFAGGRYARIKWTPYTSKEERTWGPSLISDDWPGITEAGFNTIDAVLPIQGVTTEFYFFSNGRVARVQVIPGEEDEIVEDPLSITDKWKSLNRAGFHTIDAAMLVPGGENEAYLFSGEKYVRIDVVNDKVTYGPANLNDKWPGLAQQGLTSVDAAIPVPNAKVDGETYFFIGTQYVRNQVVRGASDKVTWGAHPIADYWKTLDWI